MLKFICGGCSFFNVLSPHPSGVRTLSRATEKAFKGKCKTNTMPHSPAKRRSVSTQACTIWRETPNQHLCSIVIATLHSKYLVCRLHRGCTLWWITIGECNVLPTQWTVSARFAWWPNTLGASKQTGWNDIHLSHKTEEVLSFRKALWWLIACRRKENMRRNVFTQDTADIHRLDKKKA